MLVLSRQRDETIMIGDDIEITIVDIRGDKVRLGITAPSTIPVHRKEVYEAIKRENKEAAKVKMDDFANLPRGGKTPNVPSGVRPHITAPAPAEPPENHPGQPGTVPPKNPQAGTEPSTGSPLPPA